MKYNDVIGITLCCIAGVIVGMGELGWLALIAVVIGEIGMMVMHLK